MMMSMTTNIEDDPQMQALRTALTETENPPLIDSDSDDGILSTYSLPTIPELSESSKEQSSLLTRSQYAMVVFHGVADTYPTDSDIVCRYTLTDGVEAAPGDRVVLFAVGWSSIKDYVVFEWAPIPEKDERDLTVVFKAADLPKDVNEFYQVCYVSNESAVCGASVPFQVRTPNNDELTFALEEDMVVVRSSTAIAQDKLFKAQQDQENLNKKKVNLEKELRSLEDKHSLTLRRLDRLQETLSTSNALNEELKKENARLLGIDEEISCVKKELEEAKIRLENIEDEKKKVQEDFEATIKKQKDHIWLLDSSVRDYEDQLMDYFVQNETMKKEREELKKEIATTEENLQQNENAKSILERKNFEIENELTVCKFNLNNAQLEILRLEVELEELEKENKKLNEDLRISKQSEETNRDFCNEYSSTDRGRLIVENTRLQRTTEDMQLMISKLEHEKSTLKQVLEDTLDAQKNVCSDHCALEKRVAQLQYQLDEVSKNNTEEYVERRKQIHSSSSSSSGITHAVKSKSLENQIETLSKLLDDSLKENELTLQENIALRCQNEILQMSISKERSTSDEYVVVSCSRGVQHNTDTNDENQPQEIGTMTINSQEKMLELNNEILKLRQQFIAQKKLADEYRRHLADKDDEINDLGSGMDVLKKEFHGAKEEMKLEIANLVSKNTALVEQEIQSRELKNEMHRLTFMNEELLVQNSSLMERIHDDKRESFENRAARMLQERTQNTKTVDTALDIENNYLREQLRSTCEQLNKTKKQAEALIVQLHEYKDRNERLESELTGIKKINNTVESRYSSLTESSEMLLEKLNRLDTKVDGNCRHECCSEPKLKEISQSVEHLLSAVEKLGSTNDEVKKDEQPSTLLDANNDLIFRLKMAHDEYQKLQTVMIHYRTKYNELKTKYMKKIGKSHHFRT